MARVKDFIIIILMVIVAILGGILYFQHNKKVVPVKMTQTDIKNPAKVAENLKVTSQVADRIVKEIQTVKKPVIVYKDVPVGDVPNKIDDTIKQEKPDSVIVTEEPLKDVNVYSIHTEPTWRFGGVLSNQDFGLAVKYNNSVYSVTKNFNDNTYRFSVTLFFASLK
jgi:hypothetical protein